MRILNDAFLGIQSKQQKELPFNLPTRLPRYLAMLNLAGKRMMVHTESKNTLFHWMCNTTNTGLHTTLNENLKVLETFVDENPSNRCLFLVFSLPALTAKRNAYWEVSTLEVDNTMFQGRKLSDRHFCLSSTDNAPFKGSPTLNINGIEVCAAVQFPGRNDSTSHIYQFVTPRDMQRVIDAYSSTCLDVNVPAECVEIPKTVGALEKQVALLRQTCSGLADDRKRMQTRYELTLTPTLTSTLTLTRVPFCRGWLTVALMSRIAELETNVKECEETNQMRVDCALAEAGREFTAQLQIEIDKTASVKTDLDARDAEIKHLHALQKTAGSASKKINDQLKDAKREVEEARRQQKSQADVFNSTNSKHNREKTAWKEV